MGLYPVGHKFVSYRAYEENPNTKRPLNLKGRSKSIQMGMEINERGSWSIEPVDCHVKFLRSQII